MTAKRADKGPVLLLECVLFQKGNPLKRIRAVRIKAIVGIQKDDPVKRMRVRSACICRMSLTTFTKNVYPVHIKMCRHRYSEFMHYSQNLYRARSKQRVTIHIIIFAARRLLHGPHILLFPPSLQKNCVVALSILIPFVDKRTARLHRRDEE